jgi:RecA-family ATPase
LTDNGMHDATVDPDVIRKWWARWPHAMIGMRTGPESGVWALDLDVDEGKNGIEAFFDLAQGRLVPETIKTRTPRGGVHMFFAWTEGVKNSTGKLAPGIDTRGGEGGYCILPPSQRADRAVYQTLTDVWPDPPPAPQWLVDLIIKPEPEGEPVSHRRINGAGYGAAALAAECDAVASAALGSRNHQLNRSAFSLGQLVAAGALDEGEVRQRLTDAAAGLAKDDGDESVKKTVNSGITAGMQQPRAIPARALSPPIKPQTLTTLMALGAPANAEGDAPPLSFLDLASWQSMPVPERAWVVRDRIPANNVTLLSGEGSVGKTILSLQLAIATVLARDWASTMPEPGPVLAIYCEDDADELHRRLDAIVRHYGASFADLADLHVMSLAGEDALLATPRRDGLMEATKLLARLRQAAADIRPKLVLLDNNADVFGGNENDRAQVRQFVGMLRGLAMAGGSGVLLTSHPSLTGISSGTGLSGSTAWNASVRSRLYLKLATTARDEEPDPDLRVLEVMKSNYGPVGETITLRWKEGLFLPVAVPGSLERMAREQKVDDLFLMLLDRWNAAGRNVSDKKTANTYAPNRFVEEPEAKAEHVTKKELTDAMERLFRAGKIHVASYGFASRGWTRIERK